MVAIGVALIAIAMGVPVEARDLSSGARGNPGQYFGPDQYPVAALRAGEQGRVVALLQIDSTGKVVSCAVTSSSGSTSLDQATCRIALDNAVFTPATDRRGRPIASSYRMPVRWVLPTEGGANEPVVAPKDSDIEMTVSVDASGEVLACNFHAAPVPPPQMQPCDEFPVGRQSRIRLTRDGRPVGGVVTRSVRVRVTLDP